MADVRLQAVSKAFGEVSAVREVTAQVADGEFVSLLGPSGCGKTTVLRMVAGFERVSGGEIWIGGRRVSGPGGHVPPNERNLGMVFQTYAVWPHMNVFENVAYPLRVRGLSRTEVRHRVGAALGMVHLEGLEERAPGQLSGGQQQRVALARALVAEPAVLLLDEPLSNLDAKLREELRLELKLLSRRLGMTVLNVTHDQAEAMSMSDRILVMERGGVVQAGTPREIYERPATRYVAGFVGTAAFLPGTYAGGQRCRLEDGAEIACDQVQGLAEGTPVEVLIRPEGVRLGGGNIDAAVLSTLYLGGETEVLLTVAGKQLRTRVPGVVDLIAGAETAVSVVAAAAFPRERS